MEKAVSELNFARLRDLWVRFSFKSQQLRGFNGDSLLHLASMTGDKDTMNFLIKKGLNVNEQDNSGNTPLHYTVIGGFLVCTQMLVDLDVIDTIRNKSG
jgi:ankyrin repeat protein